MTEAAGSPPVPGPSAVEPTTEESEMTFEQLMAELERVTEALATGELGIEAAADLYERAERLHAVATARLAQVQARVDGLRERQAPGPGGAPLGGPQRRGADRPTVPGGR